MKKVLATAAILLTAACLPGCGEQPVRPAEPERSVLSAPALSVPQVALPPDLQLEAAQRALQQRQLASAASILGGLQNGNLSREERVQWLLLQTELLHLQGQTQAALAMLESRSAPAKDTPPALAWRLTRWQLLLTRSHRGALAAARMAGKTLADTSDTAQRQFLAAQLWDDLSRCPEGALQRELKTATGNWAAWVELALTAAQVTAAPSEQAAKLARWKRRNPQHQAANPLPDGLDRLAELAAGYPSKVALLLPLGTEQATAGHAVLDGFMATGFLARERGWPALDVEVLDMANFHNVNAAYEAAVRGGADLVIGSLDAEQAGSWRPASPLKVPLLALNWLPERANGRLWQWGPDADDEARQLAEMAFARSGRRALLVRPEGSWGERTSRSLLERWRTFEGSVAAEAIYSGQDDYSSSLKEALDLAASERRADRIRQIMGQGVGFTPRRRQDFDVIFLLAEEPHQARSIKPLLAFHYAGDLPVYSTSEVFGKRAGPQEDKDINGIFTLAPPWDLHSGSTLPSQILEAGGDPALSHWYALGADAYLLGWRMAQLAAGEDHRIRGYSGLLRMEKNGRVRRELVPAVIRGGVPAAL